MSDDAELAEVAARERQWRHERCERHAADVIAASAGLPGRAGLWVTVVVHERNGDASACVSTCLTAEELRSLGPVLRHLGEQLSATSAEPALVASPWNLTPRSE